MTHESEFRADLHCHSTCSDGSNTPKELLHLAKLAKLSGLSITDHDTIEAYSEDFFGEAAKINIKILTGVEFSSESEETPVHILGYGFSLTAPAITGFVEEIQKRRNARNLQILEKLAKRNMHISEEELKQIAIESGFKKSIGRPHIAAIMVKKRYVQSMQEAFQRYLVEGCPCHAVGFKFSPLETIAAIQESGGKAVLAHPHFIRKGKLLKYLLSLPFDGIECYYGNLHKRQETPWVKIANEKGWIATGGSDYHGVFKPHIPIGCSWVSESTFEKLCS